MPSACKAKNPTVCPYHRNVYGFANAPKIITKLDNLYSEITKYTNVIDPKMIQQRQRLEKAYASNKILLDATPEGLETLKRKLVETPSDSMDYLKLQSRKAKVKELLTIHQDSEDRLKKARANIEKQLFTSKINKTASLSLAIEKEKAYLTEECNKKTFFVQDNRKSVIESAYAAAHSELSDFQKSLTNKQTKTSDSKATFAGHQSLTLSNNLF